MAHIVDSIAFINNFKSQIEQGTAVAASLKRTLHSEETEFSAKMALWYQGESKGEVAEVEFNSHYQRNFLRILKLGLRGAPILEPIRQLEDEMNYEFEIQWKAFLESLPTKLSIPMLLFFFPSYLVLMFGPLVNEFMKGVGQ